MEELSSSDTSDNDEDQDTSTIFISRNKKENWSTTPHTNNMAELLLVTYITTDQALHALQNCNAIQFLVHSDYFLETSWLKKFVIGQVVCYKSTRIRQILGCSNSYRCL